jgi:hypothetical protein
VKNAASFLACALLIPRLPVTISDTCARVPSKGTSSGPFRREVFRAQLVRREIEFLKPLRHTLEFFVVFNRLWEFGRQKRHPISIGGRDLFLPAGRSRSLRRDKQFVVRIETPGMTEPVAGGPALQWLADNAVDDELPSDLSAEHDHYLYGTPKRG